MRLRSPANSGFADDDKHDFPWLKQVRPKSQELGSRRPSCAQTTCQSLSERRSGLILAKRIYQCQKIELPGRISARAASVPESNRDVRVGQEGKEVPG